MIEVTARRRITRWMKRWARVWGDPSALDGLVVEFSPRLRSSWARAYPRRGHVSLSLSLRDEPTETLRAVVCHEAAHVFLHRQGKAGPRPHGPEWKELVRRAGELPEVKRPGKPLPRAIQTPPRWTHRCPICQSVRLARRPVSRWRCAACSAAGLDGPLLIERVP